MGPRSVECKKCYNVRYNRERRGKGLARAPRPQQSGPTTYHGAHKRLSVYRGKASQYACAWCPNPAQEWSYNGQAGELEQRGKVTRRRGDRLHITLQVWSGDVSFYDPLCIPCHTLRDGRGGAR